MIRSVDTTVSRFRSLAARLHPNSEVRFVVRNPDGTHSELALVATDFHQNSVMKAGYEVPSGPPNATFILAAADKPSPLPTAAEPVAEGRALKLLEKGPPNSSDPS